MHQPKKIILMTNKWIMSSIQLLRHYSLPNQFIPILFSVLSLLDKLSLTCSSLFLVWLTSRSKQIDWCALSLSLSTLRNWLGDLGHFLWKISSALREREREKYIKKKKEVIIIIWSFNYSVKLNWSFDN